MSDGDKQTDDSVVRKRDSGKGFKVFLALLAAIAGGTYWASIDDGESDELALPELLFDDDTFAEETGEDDETDDPDVSESTLLIADEVEEELPQEVMLEVVEEAVVEAVEPEVEETEIADENSGRVEDESEVAVEPVVSETEAVEAEVTDETPEDIQEDTPIEAEPVETVEAIPAEDTPAETVAQVTETLVVVAEPEVPAQEDVAEAAIEQVAPVDQETVSEETAPEPLVADVAVDESDAAVEKNVVVDVETQTLETDTPAQEVAEVVEAEIVQEVETVVLETPQNGDASEAEDIADVPVEGVIEPEIVEADEPVVVEEAEVADVEPVVVEPTIAPETQDETDAELPKFDLVRIDKSGGGLVAGRAAPGTTVRVLADGQEIAVVEASAKGEFVAFVQTPDGNEGQRLSLSAQSGAGSTLNSRDSVIILPGEEGGDDAPAILKAAPEGVRVIQPLGLAKVDNVTLDVITYDEEGAVLLSGRAPKEQPIRIYVDRTPITDIRSTASGVWEAKLPSIKEGRYVLRVDALRADGTVESRAESPFQRVFPTAKEKLLSQVTVQPGNTLWVMAQERYGDGFHYSQIFAANKDLIRDPDLIYPGQIFALPEQ